MEEERIPSDIQARIREYDLNLERWTYYELLYITKSATTNDIKKAYRKLVQLMHPDRYGLNLGEDEKSKLERIFNEINNAYNTLCNESERMKYDQTLILAEDQGKPIKLSTDEQVSLAQFKRGVQALQQNETIKAIEFFKSAITLDQQKPEYHAKLAFALSNHPNPRIRKTALEVCKEAIRMNQENPNYHALMGSIYHKIGDLENAELCYRRALSWNPQHGLAKRQLKVALDEKAKRKPSTIKDKFMGLFRKK